MYYVYALMDVRTNLPFYIGTGLKKNNRHADHFKERVDTAGNKHKVYKIQFLKSAGVDIPVNILVDNILDESNAYKVESEYIQKYGRENIDPAGILVNICLDNRPPNWKGKKQSKEHIANRVNSYKKTCNTVGRKGHTEETKRKIARYGEENSFYRKSHSDELKQAHSNRMKGNKNNAKKYIFTSPGKIEYIVIGSFAKFCKDNNLVVSTMEKALYYNKIPNSGRCKDWKIKRNLNDN